MTLLAAGSWALLAVVVLTTGVWILSLRFKDASLIDLFWGPLFVTLGWLHWTLTPDPGPAATIALILITIWGLRLAVHLARRNLGGPEDPRYAAMRAAGGPGWPFRALVTVFWLQAGLAWVVAWPLVVVVRAPAGLGPGGFIGIAVAAIGIAFEATADHQLARFKADPNRQGQVMDRGLWRYSRHPNYFGDAVFWWGLFILAASLGAAWTVFAPVLMTFLLMNVSGVPLLEPRLEVTRPGYRDYVRRTSAFLPLVPPRRSMTPRIVRTLSIGLPAGLVLAWGLVPALDAMGRILLMPPLYYPAARVLAAAFWLVGVAAVWVYRPAGEGGSRPAEPPTHRPDSPVDSDRHPSTSTQTGPTDVSPPS